MSAARPVRSPARQLDVRDCSTCARSSFDGATLRCGAGELEALAWRDAHRDLFLDGFPVIPLPLPCPTWCPAWGEETP